MELICEESVQSPSNIESLCFDSICRSCLAPSAEMRDLFLKDKINIGACVLKTCIHELIYSCTQIEMNENDGLPRLVCETCIEVASSAFAFRSQILNSDKILKKILVKRQLQQNNEKSVGNQNVINIIEEQKITGKRKKNIKNYKQSQSENNKNNHHPQSEKKKSVVKSRSSTVSHTHNSTRITRSLKAKSENITIQSDASISLDNIQMVSGKTKSDEISIYVYDDIKPNTDTSQTNLKISHTQKNSPTNNIDICTESFKPDNEDIESLKTSFSINNEVINNSQCIEQPDKISSLIIDIKEENLEKSSMSDIFDELGVESNTSTKEKKSRSKNINSALLKNEQKKNRTIYAPLYEFPDKPQECSICSISCATTSALIKHRSETHGSKKYQCITCGNGFTTTRGLRIHLRLHTGEKPEICSTCGKAFSDPRTLKSHERIHSGNNPFPCPICGKRFPARLPLAHHFRSHTGERPHQCQLCNKAYVQAHSLQVHMRTHTGVKPYPCDNCGKAFTNNTSLSVHMLTHNGLKNFQCTICGKRMARSGELTVHLRTHSGERPFSCSVCQKAFTNSGALRVHMPTHTGVKNFVCTVCGKRVARAIELRVHMRTHTGERMYSCQHCHKKFSTSSNMRLHERKHTGEKPFICYECGRGFADSHVLRNHERTHTGERPHVCPTCGRAFVQRSSLRTHLNTHHKAARKNNPLQTGKNPTYNNSKMQQLPVPSGGISKLIQHYANPISTKLQITTEPTNIDDYNTSKAVLSLEEYNASNFRGLVASSSSENQSNISADAIPMLKTATSVQEGLNATLVPVTLISNNSSAILNAQTMETGISLSESDEHTVFNGNKNQLIKFRKSSETNQFIYR